MNAERIAPDPRQNQILAALPEMTLNRLKPFLQPVSLPLGKVLYESGDKQRYAYFPRDGISEFLPREIVPWLSALIVGGAVTLIGLIFLIKGRRQV